MADTSKMYTETDSLNYGLTSQRDPLIIKGRSALYKPAFFDFADLMLTGIPASFGEFANDMSSIIKRWSINMVRLQGTDISAPDAQGMIKVLPNGHSQYHLYEDSIPETTRVTTVATTKTIASPPTIVFSLSAAEAKKVQENDLIINWSNSETKVARVTSVNGTLISIVAWGNGASAFSAVTDFFVSTTSLDFIQIISSVFDPRNPSTFPASRIYEEFADTSVMKTYNTQLIEDHWMKVKVADTGLRAYGGMSPKTAKNRRTCFLRHKKKLSGACLWGQVQDVTASSNQSSFKGLNASIVTNVTTLSDGALSLSDLDNILVDQIGARMGSNELYALGSFQTTQIVESLFNSLVATNQADVIQYESGFYSITLTKVRYKGMTIHLIPLADFTYDNENAQSFPILGASNGTAWAQKLFIVDPAAINIVLGSVNDGSPLFFTEELGVQDNDETFYFEKNVLRSNVSFALLHEKTSAKIEGIRTADLNA